MNTRRLPWKRRKEQIPNDASNSINPIYQSSQQHQSYEIAYERIIEEDGTLQYRAIATKATKHGRQQVAVVYFESEGQGIMTFEGSDRLGPFLSLLSYIDRNAAPYLGLQLSEERAEKANDIERFRILQGMLEEIIERA